MRQKTPFRRISDHYELPSQVKRIQSQPASAQAQNMNQSDNSTTVETASNDGPSSSDNAVSHPQQNQQHVVDDMAAFLNVLPSYYRTGLDGQLASPHQISELLEVIIDLGRVPEARFVDGSIVLSDREATREDIQSVIAGLGRFGDDNRAGIERTLHRFSAIRDREGTPVGLTCRVGRAVFGSVRLIQDLIESGRSVLILGRPGVGKTTILREVARVLADNASRRVVIVDTSNEIGGDGAVAHPAVGRARRMQVPNTELQHRIMIEAVENHMPEVVVIDEIGTELEAIAARTIAERGVQLVATAHGNTLGNVISNPTLSDLVGGTQAVTLGDIEARRRRTQKTVLERKHTPTFDVVVEMHERNYVGVHNDVGRAVDRMLRGLQVPLEMRRLKEDGTIESQVEDAMQSEDGFETAAFDLNSIRSPRRSFELSSESNNGDTSRAAPSESRDEGTSTISDPPPVRVHPFGVPRDTIRSAIRAMGVPAALSDSAREADVLVTTKLHYGRRPPAVKRAERDGVPVYVLRRGTREQIEQFLSRFETQRPPLTNGKSSSSFEDEIVVEEALEEAERAVERVLSGDRKVNLSAQSAHIRRLQHALAARYNVGSSSTGHEPNRHVIIRRRRR